MSINVFKRKEEYEIYQADVLDFLDEFRGYGFPCAIADPPYNIARFTEGIEDGAFRTASKNTMMTADWDYFASDDDYYKFMDDWIKRMYNALARDSCAYIFHSALYIDFVYVPVRNAGFMIRNNIIWYKRNAPPGAPVRYHMSYEPAAFVVKGTYGLNWKKPGGNIYRDVYIVYEDSKTRMIDINKIIDFWNRVKKESMASVISLDKFHELVGLPEPDFVNIPMTSIREREDSGYHPSPKPLSLIMDFIRVGSKEGDDILDLFSGGGSTAEACVRLGRKPISVDGDLKWCKNYVKRIDSTISTVQSGNIWGQFTDVLENEVSGDYNKGFKRFRGK